MSGTDKLYVVVKEDPPIATVTRDLAKAAKAVRLTRPVNVVVIDVPGGEWEFFEAEFIEMAPDAIEDFLAAAPSNNKLAID